MTRVVDIKLERERVAFAERAVMHFANHPEQDKLAAVQRAGEEAVRKMFGGGECAT